MSKTDNILDTIVSEFPQYRKKITLLYNESISFTEVCDDYALCLQSIRKLELLKDSAKQNEIRDLNFALTELREELLSRI